MPGSTASGTVSQAGSIGSKASRARTKTYHKVAHTSQVDESLFGERNSTLQRRSMLEGKWNNDGSVKETTPLEKAASERSAKRSGGRKNKKETVRIVTKDLIRNLIVPNEDPSGRSIVITREDLHRLLRASRVLTVEERQAQLEMMKRRKEELQDEVLSRKAKMAEHDAARVKNEALSEIEEEAIANSQNLLAKAERLRQEQEDEIKYLNELILNAKCHAIRDAQITEKKIMEKEMHEEEKRLDMMMEKDRRLQLKMEEEISHKRKEQQLIGANRLLEQIALNEQEKLLEMERKDAECRAINAHNEKMCVEEKEEMERLRERQIQLREELDKGNRELLTRKVKEKDRERALEEQVRRFQQEKAEREAALEAEQERVRLEKEREVARLRAMQEREQDKKAAMDALRAKRAQEAAERQWRQKEAEAAEKMAKTQAMLAEARKEQLEARERHAAVQAQRERADFERVLRAQRELQEKEIRQEQEVHKSRKKFAEDVRQQIKQKENEKIAQRNAFFEEGVQLDSEAKARRVRLDALKEEKLQQLRELGLHEKYIAGVERKIRAPQHISA